MNEAEEVESDFRPLYKMYQDVINSFGRYMIKELAANCDKGNRTGKDGWLSKKLDKKFWMSELYYHCGKLQQALKEDNDELIKEYSADIANLSLMVFDWKFDLLKPLGSENEFWEVMREQIKINNNKK